MDNPNNRNFMATSDVTARDNEVGDYKYDANIRLAKTGDLPRSEATRKQNRSSYRVVTAKANAFGKSEARRARGNDPNVRSLSSVNEIEDEAADPSSGQDEVLVEADGLESDSDSLDDDLYREYDHFSTSDSEDENKYGHVS